MPFIPRLESLGFSGIAYKMERLVNKQNAKICGFTSKGETVRSTEDGHSERH
jgi:hypothetical protein